MKTTALKVILSLVLSMGASAVLAQDKAPQVSEAAVRELLTLTGQKEIMLKGVREIVVTSSKAMPNVPPEFWSRFLAKAESSDVLTLIVPIYQRHLTPVDLDAMLVFYRSEAGKRMIQLQPTLMAEGIQVGSKWGEELGRQVGFEMMQEEVAKKKKAKTQL